MKQQSNTVNDFTHIDLFSGIGGFSLASQWVGFKTILFCEIDEFCQKVLKKHWPQVPNIPDIRDIDGTQFRGATLLTGGFPCQPFSHAGQRRGKEDDRHLWPEMLRVISGARPTWIIGENVAGIRSMEIEDGSIDLDTEDDDEKGGFSRYTIILDEICSQLENIGYEVQPVIIPACAKNAPHRRDRVWIIANSKGSRCERGRSVKMGERGKMANGTEREDSINPNSIGTRRARGKFREVDRYNRGEEVCLSRDRISQTGWERNWLEVAARFCRVDDGLPSWVYSDRVKRLKALGNAIVPQIAYEIIKCIYRIENDNQT